MSNSAVASDACAETLSTGTSQERKAEGGRMRQVQVNEYTVPFSPSAGWELSSRSETSCIIHFKETHTGEVQGTQTLP
jgi:hypothetical protein